MMSWEKAYKQWDNFKDLDEDLKNQLVDISTDEKALEDAFYTNLTFGTGGIRGILGPGTNRMNRYTVRKAVEGLARYLSHKGEKVAQKGVAVAYDCRYMSKEFALETAKVLGRHNIPTYIYETLRPTPYLSFAVRHLGAAAGVMITASHNPPEYNGFKVYNEEGGQMPPTEADELITYVNEVEDELQIPIKEESDLKEKGLLTYIGKSVDEAYLKQLKQIVKNEKVIKEQADKLQIVFTPLHGTAHQPILDGLHQLGFQHVSVVKNQAQPDPDFSTVASPNPEEPQAFQQAIELGKEKQADLLIATDPDADRLGVAVKDEDGEYTVLSGNQLGALLLDYTLSQTKKLPEDATVIKTIVTSEMGRAIAEYYNVEMMETLTGFKYIAEKIRKFKDANSGTFLFGYEESYGYLLSDYVRDKDAVQAAMAACEMAAYWKSEGKSLYEALHHLYERHGYYEESLASLTLKGKEGTEKISQIMEEFRNFDSPTLGTFQIEAIEDYQVKTRTEIKTGNKTTLHLPADNVIKFHLEQDSWCCLRPSGTEPKIKCYFGVKTASHATSLERVEKLKEAVVSLMKEI